MPAASDTQLQELLAHPSVWRGRSHAAVETFSTGFAALDAGLPGGGWARHGVVEVLTPQPGVGELYLLLPLLANLSRAIGGGGRERGGPSWSPKRAGQGRAADLKHKPSRR